MKDSELKVLVKKSYGDIAKKGGSCCPSKSSCCGAAPAEDVSKSIGYTEDDLEAVPSGANLGLGCGNPIALASLKDGETVLDLGSGAGFDSFLAAGKVGEMGRVIGVDMTAEMIDRARENAARGNYGNVEFRMGEIEELPVADTSVDVVISNCVINLSPDKGQVWREIARVLKPGGRAAVSDLALLKPLPQEMREMVEALVGCIAGAVLVKETERMAKEAGLVEIELVEKRGYVEKMTDWNDPLYRKIIENLPAGTRMNEFVTSLYVTGKKPSAQ